MSVPVDPDKMKHDGHAFADARDDLPFFVNYELDDIGLDPYEFRVYIHALRRASGRKGSGTLWEGVMKAAKHCRMDHKTYRRSLANLVEKGLLAAVERKGRTTEYFVLPKRKWKVPLPETVDPPLPDTEGVPLPETVDEGIHPKGYTVSTNPSSTFVDVSASKSTSSTRSEAESSSSLKVVDLAASSAHARANKEASPASQVAAVIEIWNSNCGLARKTRKPTEKLERQVGAYIRAMKKNGDDPVTVMAFMAAEVAREGFYDRKYGLGNLLAGTNWEPRYQAYLESLEAGTHSLAVGQRVSWLSNPSMPFSRRYYGHVSELLEDGAVAIQAEPNQPGLHYNPSSMNPERLTVEDE